MREFTDDEKRQILAELRTQRQAEDAAWVAALRAKGWCYNAADHGTSNDDTHESHVTA